MVEDPWAELETASTHAQYGQEDAGSSWPHNAWEVTSEKEEQQQMSESMIAQVGDTLCERNERLLEDTATPDTSTLDPEHSNSHSPDQESVE